MHRNKVRIAAAILVLVALGHVSAQAARRSTMNVSCVVLPHIGLSVNGGAPVYGAASATTLVNPGEALLSASTNDTQAKEFVLSVSSDGPATVNGIELAPKTDVELGHYRYSAPVVLRVSGEAPVLLRVTRGQP